MKTKIISLIDELEEAVSFRTLSMFRDDDTRANDDMYYKERRKALESAIEMLQGRVDFHTFASYKKFYGKGK